MLATSIVSGILVIQTLPEAFAGHADLYGISMSGGITHAFYISE
ncbi:hypothetical protein [Paraburkholderia sp. CNPSo 3274]|nr:hypothetical protein [Paraburkholderia sp. CNPSo 3274]